MCHSKSSFTLRVSIVIQQLNLPLYCHYISSDIAIRVPELSKLKSSCGLKFCYFVQTLTCLSHLGHEILSRG